MLGYMSQPYFFFWVTAGTPVTACMRYLSGSSNILTYWCGATNLPGETAVQESPESLQAAAGRREKNSRWS
jgi:hypothetical protein